MPADTVFDQAQFKNHLDDIFRDRIIDETYPQRPTSKNDSPPPSLPANKSGDGGGEALPPLTIVVPNGLQTDFGPRPVDGVSPIKPVAESQTDIAKAQEVLKAREAREASDRAAQKDLLAHPEELRRLFPEMLNVFDINHYGYLDWQEINIGLDRASITDLQRNYLTVLRNGYSSILRDTNKFVPGIEEYDLARIEKAMNRNLPEDPLWRQDSRVVVPTLLLWSGVVLTAASMNLAMKYPGTNAALLLGFLAVGEGACLYNHLSGRYNGVYDDIEKQYRTFVKEY